MEPDPFNWTGQNPHKLHAGHVQQFAFVTRTAQRSLPRTMGRERPLPGQPSSLSPVRVGVLGRPMAHKGSYFCPDDEFRSHRSARAGGGALKEELALAGVACQ